VVPQQEIKVEPPLCEEQQRLVDLILSKKNVFYTGSAGCGKSTVLKAFVQELKQQGRNVVIVAPTGKAALEINGSTYFTFAGWTPDHFKKPLEKLKQGAHGKFVQKRMREVDTLIIDEISMMENHAFERLNEVMKEARSNRLEAFGGVQLVVTGDFCQLPPVKVRPHDAPLNLQDKS
jgi:ATP-dependent DNA helicase PIF1